jgi:hypothetical protein
MLVSLLVLLRLASAQAEEGDKTAALPLWEHANEASDRGDFEKALELYRSAYERYPSEKILLNIAMILRQLHRDVEAVEAYHRYLIHPKADPTKREAVLQTLSEIETRVGRIDIQVDEDGVHIFVDDRDAGEASQGHLVVHVSPGPHTLVAEKPGVGRAASDTDVGPGERAEIRLQLGRVAPATPPSPPSPAPTPMLAEARRDAADPGRTLKTAGLVVGGVGAAAIAGGVYFGVRTKSLSDGLSGKYSTADLADAQAANRNMLISYSVAGAALATGAVLYYLGVREQSDAPTVAVSDSRVTLGWRF